MDIASLWPAFAGGVLIGLAAIMLMAANGRIAGISGMVEGALFPKAGEWTGNLLFLAGLVAGTLLYRLVATQAGITVTSSPLLLIAAGLLVGFGTRLGSGCTSGHGVCGMARLSKRSLIATPVFMLTAGITVFVLRHVVGG